MKKLVGGDYLLDLSSIELEESEDGATYTSITNTEILQQLTNLKTFVKNPQMIKPVWVKLYNGETDELIVVRGSLANVDAGEFDIVVVLDTHKLRIHVEFTQAELSDHTPIDDWYIDTNDAKYLFTSNTQEITKELSDFTGDVNITGDVVITGDFEVDGNAKLFENIIDKDGHKRFIEGDIDLVEDLTGVTKSYGKWSLSGTHLMIVIAGTIANTTVLNAGTFALLKDLPDWIFDKIIPMIASVSVEQKIFLVFNDDYSNQSITGVLQKTQNRIQIYNGSLTASKDRNYRFVFDLLIDNE